MPVITIQVTREGTTPEAHGVTAEQKAQLIRGVSELLLNVLGKPVESTFVIIDEVELENWGWGGLPVLEYRQRLEFRPYAQLDATSQGTHAFRARASASS